MSAGLGRVLHRAGRIDAPGRAALTRILAEPTFELLPLRSVHDQIAALPRGARVSVTASPAKGLEATIDLAAALQAAGFTGVPHLAARTVRDAAHLADLLARMAAGGITQAFVVGGDATEPGAFPDGLSLLRAIAEVGPAPGSLGIPCYPDGHPFIADDALLAALRAKAPFAAWMTTQLCFDAGRIASWLAARRAEGIATPAIIGVAGATEPQRLLAIAARIGVRDTKRFLAKNVALVGRVVRSGGFYRPDSLLAGLASAAADPALGVAGIHLYTFNQVAATEAWRRQYLARLATEPRVPA